MSSLFWLNPSGLWALAGPAAAAILYLFHRRFKPRPATGLFLWGAPRRDAAAGRRVRDPLLSRAFLFDMLAAVLLALAVAGPALRAKSPRPAAIVLDDSFAMRSKNLHVEARIRAEKILAENGRSAIILAGELPRVLAGFDAAPGEAAKRLASYLPAANSGDLAAAIALAARLDGENPDLYVFTNREPPSLLPDAGGAILVETLAGAGDNLALGDIWRLPANGGGERAIVSVRNYSPRGREADIVIDAPERLFSASIAMPPGGEAFVEARLAGVSDRLLSVRAIPRDGEDAIAEDSAAIVPPQPDGIVTFGFDGVGDAARRYFRLGLIAAGCAPADGAPPDLLVSDGGEARGTALTLALAAAGEPAAFLPPIVVDAASRLCRDVDLAAAPWLAADRDLRPENAREIFVMAGNTPLYWRSSERGLHMNLIPERSPTTLDAAWPVLLANLAGEARRLKPGLRKTLYRPGEALEFNPGLGVGLKVALVDAAGLPAAPPGAGVPRAPTQPGVYLLRNGDAETGPFSVLPHYGDASDTTVLSPTAASARRENAGAEPDGGTLDLTLPALVLALACLVPNWRRRAGGTDRCSA